MIYIGEQFTLNSSLMQEEKTRCPEPSLDTDQQSDRYNLHRLTRTSLAQPSPICHQHLIPMWWTLLWKLTRYWPGTDISTISSTFDSNVAGLAVPGQTDTPHHTTVDWLSHDPHYVITMWFQCMALAVPGLTGIPHHSYAREIPNFRRNILLKGKSDTFFQHLQETETLVQKPDELTNVPAPVKERASFNLCGFIAHPHLCLDVCNSC